MPQAERNLFIPCVPTPASVSNITYRSPSAATCRTAWPRRRTGTVTNPISTLVVLGIASTDVAGGFVVRALVVILAHQGKDASRGIRGNSGIGGNIDASLHIEAHESGGIKVTVEKMRDGRELYVGLVGNVRLTVLPIRELVFREVPPNEPKIATFKAKWDEEYRKRWGLENRFAEDLDPQLVSHIEETCKRIYRLLTIGGYARIDLRLTADGKVYFIEANPNPILANDEDFALSAAKAGLPYPQLIDRIVRHGMNTVRD